MKTLPKKLLRFEVGTTWLHTLRSVVQIEY